MATMAGVGTLWLLCRVCWRRQKTLWMWLQRARPWSEAAVGNVYERDGAPHSCVALGTERVA